MELVYLWVEKYKNIYHQGFNFSPRFECTFHDNYNDDGTLKDDCILDIKPKEHVENFFGKNIYVTAIVGENGSGKSSILKLILFLLYCKSCIENKSYDTLEFMSYLIPFRNSDLFLIVLMGKTYKKISLNSTCFSQSVNLENDVGSMGCEKNFLKKIRLNQYADVEELSVKELTFFSFYLNYMLDTLNDGYHDNWINRIYHKHDNYETPLLIQPNKHDTNTLNDVVNLFMIDYINQRRLILLYKDMTKNQKITSFFNPNYLKIKNDFIDNYRVDMSDTNYIELKIIKKIANKLTLLLHIKDKNYKLDNTKIPVEFKKIEDEKDYEYMNLLYLVFKILTIDKKLFNQDIYDLLEKDILKKIEDNALPAKEYLKNYNFEEIINKVDKDDYRIKKILISIEFRNKKIYENQYFQSLMNDEKVLISDMKTILEYLPSWIDIIFYENNKSFETLSSGEKSIFRTTIDIVYQIQKVKLHYKHINIMLDETELGLHPQWQKEYLKNILESIELYIDSNFSVNLIFATHSPFILSDIPKENVIFLENGKQVDVKIDTFGANIHALLSHGFFMKDGLMGEFAKEKIQSIIKYHEEIKNKDLLKDKHRQLREEEKEKYERDKKNNFWNIQSIIGDDYLKQVIKNHLVEIEKILYKDMYLDNEIERMKEELKKLEALKNA
jgi:predicted ATPase